MTEPPALEAVAAEGVTKVFGTTRALGGVTARFARGTITALVGANGSGKSTLLGILATLVRPTSGRVRFGGADEKDPRVRSAIGYLGHAPLLYPDLTPAENVALFATLHGLGPGAVTEALAREGADGFASRPCRGLSRGQLQRVSLARALVGAPSVLLLDEPTTGLDTESASRLADRLRAERDRGAIVVLATHDAMAEGLADVVLRLERGVLAGA